MVITVNDIILYICIYLDICVCMVFIEENLNKWKNIHKRYFTKFDARFSPVSLWSPHKLHQNAYVSIKIHTSVAKSICEEKKKERVNMTVVGG